MIHWENFSSDGWSFLGDGRLQEVVAHGGSIACENSRFYLARSEEKRLTRPQSSLRLLSILTRETRSREARAADAVRGLPRPFLDRLQIITTGGESDAGEIC